MRFRKSVKPQLESQIKRTIVGWLNHQPGTFAFITQSQGTPNMINGKFCGFRKNPAPGMSDIIGLKDGKFFSMEVKTPTGKVTDNQRDFLAKVAELGKGYACVVRSVEDAEQAWREI